MVSKIAYIMSRFPHLPETFILREMDAIEQLGWDISLYPLIGQHQEVIHHEAKSWIPRAHYSPYLSLSIVIANFRLFRKMPRKYLNILQIIFRENIQNVSYLVRSLILFPKAGYLSLAMQAEGIDHIHAHYATYPALLAWIIHHFTGISYSVTVHAHDIFVSQVMVATKLKNSAFIVAISEFNRQYLLQKIDPALEEKIYIVHCGVDPFLYQTQREYNKDDCFEILNVGSLQAYKGQIYLLQACRLLKDRGINFRCRIVGEGEERRTLETYIHAYQLQDQVELLGAQSQDNVSRLLPKAHCYVQPSVITLSGKMEGIPVALMEALACRLPVVATEISGIPELIRPGETGYLVPPENPAALADTLQEVFENSEQAHFMAENGRAEVVDKFNLATNSGLLAALFEKHVFYKKSRLQKES